MTPFSIVRWYDDGSDSFHTRGSETMCRDAWAKLLARTDDEAEAARLKSSGITRYTLIQTTGENSWTEVDRITL